MFRVMMKCMAAGVMLLTLGGWACRFDDHGSDFEEDVTVEITGDSGTDFTAFFEDDDHSDTFSADVPFVADFNNREEFFTAVVDKDSGGSERICVRVSTDHDSRRKCTELPFGRVTVTLVF